MAPGSYDSLAAAIDAGADAVYFGVEGLNMRSRSSAASPSTTSAHSGHLPREERKHLPDGQHHSHYDDDIPKVDAILDAAREAGITAVIASDIAVIRACRRKGVEVHISTQCNISNTEAVRFMPSGPTWWCSHASSTSTRCAPSPTPSTARTSPAPAARR